MAVERFAGQAGVRDGCRWLQRHRREHAPVRRGGDRFGEGTGVGDVAAEAGLQAFDALFADEEPELEGAKAAPRGTPSRAGFSPGVNGALQKAGLVDMTRMRCSGSRT